MFGELFNVHLTPTQSFISFLVALLFIIAMWKIFEKAGRAGWLALIPILNLYVLIRITNYSGILILLFLIPFVNVVFMILIYLRLCRAFGWNEIMILGLIFLPFIFFPMLGFGGATYSKARIK